MNIVKANGQCSVVSDGKVLFSGTRRDCRRFIHKVPEENMPAAKKKAPTKKKVAKSK